MKIKLNKEAVGYNILGFIQQMYPIGQLFLTRYFIEPKLYGRWTAVNVLISFILIFDIGLGLLLQQKFAKKYDSKIILYLLSQIKSLTLKLSLILLLFFLLYLYFFEKELNIYEKGFALMLFLLMYYNNFLISFNRTFKRYNLISRSSFYYFIINLTILLCTLPFIGYLGIYISSLASIIVSAWLLNKHENGNVFGLKDILGILSYTKYQKLLFYSSLRLKIVEFPLAFLNIADMIFAKYFFSFENLSFYSTAKSIATAIKKSLSWIKTRDIIHTYSIKKQQDIEAEKNKIVKSIARENLILIPLVIAGAYIFCYYIFKYFFVQYLDSIVIFPIVSMVLFCRGIQEQYRTIDFSRNQIRPIFISNLIGSIILLLFVGLYYINGVYDVKIFSYIYVVGVMLATLVLIYNTSSYSFKEKIKVTLSLLIPYLVITLYLL